MVSDTDLVFSIYVCLLPYDKYRPDKPIESNSDRKEIRRYTDNEWEKV